MKRAREQRVFGVRAIGYLQTTDGVRDHTKFNDLYSTANADGTHVSLCEDRSNETGQLHWSEVQWWVWP